MRTVSSLNHPNKPATAGRSLGTPVRDSDLFPTLPSTAPAAPCWAKLCRAYGAGFSARKFHSQIPSLVLTHTKVIMVRTTSLRNGRRWADCRAGWHRGLRSRCPLAPEGKRYIQRSSSTLTSQAAWRLHLAASRPQRQRP